MTGICLEKALSLSGWKVKIKIYRIDS